MSVSLHESGEPRQAAVNPTAVPSSNDLDPERPTVPSEAIATDDIPDGGYGWVCVGCLFALNANTWDIVTDLCSVGDQSYGVFLAKYLATDYFPGATYLQFAFVGGLSISQALLVSPVATELIRRCGTRTTLLAGVLLETLALVGASFATKTWQLFLSQGVCFGWGIGFQFVASVNIIPQWFLRRRSVANGIATGGSGFGGLAYSLAAQSMIQKLGLPWAFRIIAIIQFAVNFTCALLIKDRNKHLGTTNNALELRFFKKAPFWLLTWWGIFSMLGYVVLLFSLADYARSVGLSPHQGSVVVAVLNLGQGLGRPAVGLFSDKTGRINIAGAMTLLTSILIFIVWILANNHYGVVVLFALVGGASCGTFWTSISPVAAQTLGIKDFKSGLAVLWPILALPTTFAEPLALRLRERTGDIYLHVQIFTGFMYVAAAVCMWLLRAWNIGELERLAVKKEKRGSDTEATPATADDQIGWMPSRPGPSSLLRRLTMMKKV